MALITCKMKSAQIGRAVEFIAILPEGVTGDYRTVYLLHGLSDDHTAWTRYTSIERYANDRGLAIIMPNAEDSFYCDMHIGPKMYSYIMQELIPYTRSMFCLSHKREDTFVAGLSMGGYGAFRLALRNPELFAAAAEFSGVMDIAKRAEMGMGQGNFVYRLFADPLRVRGSDDDLFHLAEKLNGAQIKPRLYMECGTEDGLYEGNVRFRDFLRTTDFTLHYEDRPGSHNWAFWDVCIVKALDFFLER